MRNLCLTLHALLQYVGVVIEGKDFRHHVLDEDGNIRQKEFDSLWHRLRVMARCSPTDKLTIVRGGISQPHKRLLFP